MVEGLRVDGVEEHGGGFPDYLNQAKQDIAGQGEDALVTITVESLSIPELEDLISYIGMTFPFGQKDQNPKYYLVEDFFARAEGELRRQRGLLV